MCTPHDAENINLKVFNLISRTNQTRYIKFYETYKCKYRLDASVCNNNVGMKINAGVNVKN